MNAKSEMSPQTCRLSSMHKLQRWSPLFLCLASHRGRSFCFALVASALLALTLPLVNIVFIYPAFTEVFVQGLERDATRIGEYILPPSLKNTELRPGVMTNRFFADIYKLEQSFGLLRVRVFSSSGEVIYSDEPTDIGHLHDKPYFHEHLLKGETYSKLIVKNTTDLDGKTVTLDVIEIYVPFLNGDKFLGAFEMYYDISERISRLETLLFYSTAAMTVMVAGLLVALLFLLKKEAAHQLERIRAEQLKDDMDRIVQHDLKSPIISILTGLTYLDEFTEMTEEQRDITTDIRQAASRSMDMINRSLDFYKMESGQYQYIPGPMDLLTIANRVVKDLSGFAEARGVEMLVTYNGSIPTDKDAMTLEADDTLCYTILANVIKNGIEASSPGERVTVSLTNTESLQVVVHNQRTVPEGIRQSFFAKASTEGKASGTGLGTYSAKLMTEIMNGTITMNTSEENGTTITMTLPRLGPE